MGIAFAASVTGAPGRDTSADPLPITATIRKLLGHAEMRGRSWCARIGDGAVDWRYVNELIGTLAEEDLSRIEVFLQENAWWKLPADCSSHLNPPQWWLKPTAIVVSAQSL